MPGGGGGKGKGGGSQNVTVTSTSTSNNTVDLVGLDDVNVDLSTEMKFPDPIHTKSELILPQPLKTESRNEIALTEPIVTQMTTAATIDMKPVVVDLCLTLGIGKLPRAEIRRPYRRHFGLTVMGVEVLGFDWSGDSSFVIDDLPPRSHLELGGAGGVHHGSHRSHARTPTVVGHPDDGGLRIVLGD